MIKRLALAAAVLCAAAAGAFFFTLPKTIDAREIPQGAPDVANGAYVFNAAGCASCHAAPDAADATTAKELPGGVALKSPFGTFYVPNISPDKTHGIGNWTTVNFVNALKYGVSPDGRHYYPAFPYVSFQKMTLKDMVDVKAYLDTLPPVATPSKPHDLPFPFNIGRGVRLWQFLYVYGKTFTPDPNASEEVNRGAYLVTGPGHCGECHTPRNFFGGPIASKALSGAPSPDGVGYVPNITPDKTGIADWTKEDIVEALTSGLTPEFDTLSGEMAKVTRETRRMTEADRNAIAAYLLSLKPISAPRPGS